MVDVAWDQAGHGVTSLPYLWRIVKIRHFAFESTKVLTF